MGSRYLSCSQMLEHQVQGLPQRPEVSGRKWRLVRPRGCAVYPAPWAAGRRVVCPGEEDQESQEAGDACSGWGFLRSQSHPCAQ